MGRIMLATSNSTDEEYGGTFIPKWELIGSNSSTTAIAVDITPYSEIRLVMRYIADDLIVGSTIVTKGECVANAINVYFSYNGLSFVRLQKGGVNLYSGSSGYEAILYGR